MASFQQIILTTGDSTRWPQTHPPNGDRADRGWPSDTLRFQEVGPKWSTRIAYQWRISMLIQFFLVADWADAHWDPANIGRIIWDGLYGETTGHRACRSICRSDLSSQLRWKILCLGLRGGWEDGFRITFFLGKRVTQLADVGRFGFQSILINFSQCHDGPF